MILVDDGVLPAEWEDVLSRVAGDLDAAEALLASLSDQAPHPNGLSVIAGVPTTPSLSGLDDRERATLRSRLLTLHARSLSAISRLSVARSENRRHRALLERAESANDRPVYVDRTA